MIKFISDEIIKSIDKAILEYNNQFYNPEDKDKKLEFYDEETGIDESVLRKLKKYTLSLNVAHLDEEEINLCSEELSKLMEYTELEDVFILVGNSKNNKQVINFNSAFIDRFNPNIKRITLTGFDLSDKTAESFSNFTNLINLRLNHCNLTKPDIIANINPNCSINIQRNAIDEEYTDKLFELLEKHHGRIETSNSTICKISETLRTKKVKLSDYTAVSSKINLSKMDELEIVVDDEIDFDDPKIGDLISSVNSLSNATIVSNAKNYIQLNKQYRINLPANIVINNVSELTCDDIINNPNIMTVKIEEDRTSTMPQTNPYSREEYLQIRTQVDKILQEIPQSQNKKQRFMDIYKYLAEHIEYDYYAISEEGKKDKNLEITCRNLYGGLIYGKCVCAGYADILRNLCACAEIEAKFIGAGPTTDAGYHFKLEDNSHAWNCVKLDNEWSYADLTWDRDSIIAKKFPLKYCLKSAEDFYVRC